MATAEGYQSSEERNSREDSNTLRAFRTESKQSIEKQIEEIGTHIVNRGSRSALAVMRRHLAESLEKLSDINQRYIMATGVQGLQRKNREQYYLLIERQTSLCFLHIDEYLTSRAEEPPSSCASRSTKSSASPKSVASSAKSKESLHLKASSTQPTKATTDDFWPQFRRALIPQRATLAEAPVIELEGAQEPVPSVRRKAPAPQQQVSEFNNTIPSQSQRRLLPSIVYEERTAIQETNREWLRRLEMKFEQTSQRILELDREMKRQASDKQGAYSHAVGHMPVQSYHKDTAEPTEKREEKRGEEPFASPADAWIFELEYEQLDHVHTSCCSGHLPKLKIRPFSGDPRDWPHFLSKFKSLVHNVVPDNAQRLAYLRELLAPHIQDSIAEVFMSPHLYPQALRELQERYGNPIIVSNAFAENLVNLQPVKTLDFRTIERIYAGLHKAVVTMQNAKYTQDLLAPSLLQQVRDKLPPYLKSLWGQEICEFNRMPNLLDFDKWLRKIVNGEAYNQHTSVFYNQEPSKDKARRAKESKTHPPTILTTLAPAASTKLSCGICKEEHRLYNCEKFARMSTEDRATFVKQSKSCFRCLLPGHRLKDCRRKVSCGVNGCKGLHHALIHGAPRANTTRPPESETDSKPTEGEYIGLVSDESEEVALLKVVPVQVRANGRRVDTFAVLDNGGETSLIRQDVAKALGLRGPVRNVRLGSFHGKDPTSSTQVVTFEVAHQRESQDVTFHVSKAYTVTKIYQSERRVDWTHERKLWPYLADLPIESTDSSRVTVLIGMPVQEAHDEYEVRKPPGVQGPRAIRTPFGWCLAGAVPASLSSGISKRINLTLDDPRTEQLVGMVESFWRTDSLVVANREAPMNNNEERALQLLKETTKLVNGHYEAGLLWREDNPHLPNNRSMALRRFFTLERKLLSQTSLASRYAVAIDEYVRLGHAKKLSPAELIETNGKTFYLPHHGVVHPRKQGKIRVVFDASARFHDTSLNSSLLKGPDLLTSSLGVLLRFRQHPIPLSADIEKMFNQVRVREEDQTALRFLWRNPGNSEPPQTFQMVVHIFGAVSSPATCMYALQKTATDNQGEFEDIAAKVRRNFYVDNFLDSLGSEEEAIKVARRMTELLKRGGFKLTKWLSSSRKVMDRIPAAQRNDPLLNLDFERLPSERTLGLIWDCECDTFKFQVHLPAEGLTKRKILSAVASVYDPLGFLNPFIITAKVLLQQMWRTGYEWDEPLPQQIVEQWAKWAGQLTSLKNFEIPRALRLADSPIASRLHVFTDASSLGFGAVAYLRHEYENDQVSIRFVMSKARVAPLKTLSIPRLELQGAIVGIRLAQICCEELGLRLKDTVFWSDSQTVLQWLHSKACKFQVFVANRIGEILEATDCAQWHHVSGKENPADKCTRACDKSVITLNEWIGGPEFLHERVSEFLHGLAYCSQISHCNHPRKPSEFFKDKHSRAQSEAACLV